MNIKSLFQLGNDTGMFDERRRAVRNYKLMQWARWATFGLYIVAVFMLYVADVWGVATFMEKNSNEYIALIVFSVISFTLSYFLASGKESVYEDIAISHSEGYKLTRGQIFAMALFASSGILFELFSATSNQQHISNTAAENAGLLKPVDPSVISVGTDPALAKRVEDAQAKLGACQAKLGTQYKDCKYSEGRLSAAQANMAAANQTAASVSSEMYSIQSQDRKEMLERFDKPMFKVVGRAVDGDTNDGMVIAVAIMITIFELQHIMSLFAYANALRRMKSAGSNKPAQPEYVDADHQQNVSSPASAAPVSAFAGAADSARQTVSEAVGHEMMKAQGARNALHQRMQAGADKVADKLDITQERDWKPTWEKTTVREVLSRDPSNVRESGGFKQSPEQLERAKALAADQDGTTYRQALRSGHKNYQDGALDAPVSKLHEPTLRTGSNNPAHRVTQGQQTQGIEKPLNIPANLYSQWCTAIRDGSCKPTVTASRSWVQKRIAASQREKLTYTPTEISAIVQVFFVKALRDGVVINNPHYTNGKPKYLLPNQEA